MDRLVAQRMTTKELEAQVAEKEHEKITKSKQLKSTTAELTSFCMEQKRASGGSASTYDDDRNAGDWQHLCKVNSKGCHEGLMKKCSEPSAKRATAVHPWANRCSFAAKSSVVSRICPHCSLSAGTKVAAKQAQGCKEEKDSSFVYI